MNPTVEMVLLAAPVVITLGAALLKIYRAIVINTEITKRTEKRVDAIESFMTKAQFILRSKGHKI